MLIVTVVNATPLQISVLSALGVVPYLFLGLIVGALMDRWRRQRTLVLTTIGRAVTLASIPVLLLLDALDFWSLAIVVLVLGVLTLFADSAAQPLLPRIVPRGSLVAANAQLGRARPSPRPRGLRSAARCSTSSGRRSSSRSRRSSARSPPFFRRASMSTSLRPSRGPPVDMVTTSPGGMRYTYQHPTLRPLALSVHVWFLGNSIVATVFAVFVLRGGPFRRGRSGVSLAVGGVGSFLGAMTAPRVRLRLGAGRAILLGRALVVVPWLMLALAPLSAGSGIAVVLVVVAAAQFLYCLAMGIEDTNDISYRQSVAPDGIQGRMNSTIRTVNRVVFFFGALLAGLLMTLLGYQLTIGIGAGVFVVAALVIVFSPLRDARHEDAATETHSSDSLSTCQNG